MKSAADIIPSLFASPETVSGNNSDVVVTGSVTLGSLNISKLISLSEAYF